MQASRVVVDGDGEISRRPVEAQTLYQRGALIFDGRTEVMVVHFMYTGGGDLFGCLGTVPREAFVKPVSRELLDRLDDVAGAPAFASLGPARAPGGDARNQELVNFELLRSLDDLRAWKERNGFRAITEGEDRVFGHYLGEGMMFLAALVPYGYPWEPGRVVNVWTRPVQVTFDTDEILYPLLGSTVEHGTHTFVSLDLLTAGGRPVDVPAAFAVTSEGDAEIGHRRYAHTRIEARLELDAIDRDLRIPIAQGAW